MMRSLVVVAVLLVLALVLVGAPGLLVTPTTSEVAPETHENRNAEIVSPGEADSGFWPYLNSRRKFERRSPVNVVVMADTETVVRVLLADSDANWEETPPDQQEADPDTHGLEVEFEGNVTNDSNDTNESLGTDGGDGTANGTDASNASTDADDGARAGGTTTGSDGPTETGPTDATEGGATTADDGTGGTAPTATGGTAPTATDGTTTDPAATGGTATNDSANESAVDEGFTFGATTITWSRTTGATRYAYVHDGEGGGRWVTETAQVHDGTYYGHRYHIRMYESPNPDEPWVIMQTHGEHFDWFTLRHRVDGSQEAQMRLESDLMATPQVDVREDVSRRYLGNSNSKDADGWATVVDLDGPTSGDPGGPVLAIFLVAGTVVTNVVTRTRRRLDDRLTEVDRRRVAAARERVDPRHLLLAGTIVGLTLGVRVGGIALERTGLLSMHAIAALLYPFIGVGLPVGTYLFARGLERRLDAAVVASGSLAVAIWLDYGVLGVSTLPIDVIVQRMLVVVALGLIAAGATRRANRDTRLSGLLLFGSGVWVLLLAGTLFGYV